MSLALRLAHVHVPHLGRRQPNDVSDESAAARVRRGSELSYPLAQLFDGPTCWSFDHHSLPLNPRARLPLAGTPNAPPHAHYTVPPNPAVEPLAASFLNSFSLVWMSR